MLPATERKTKPRFNHQTNEDIGWAEWSWNPITGCEYICVYCYARDIARRSDPDFKPAFHPDRLGAAANTKPNPASVAGGMVFVCSMSELFGEWVPNDWIWPVIEEVKANPHWTFLFLTKHPRRYLSIRFPDNAWIGATADTQARAGEAEKWMGKAEASVKFVSVEPMLEPIHFHDIKTFDWVIIGGRSRTSTGPRSQPELQWVMDLTTAAKGAGLPVFWKSNMHWANIPARFQEHPKPSPMPVNNGCGISMQLPLV